MSLKPTENNHAVVGIAYSAKTWARHAVGGDKQTGHRGFEEYRSSGGWYHPMHYKHISRDNPHWSKPEALSEMSETRESLAKEIVSIGADLDAMVMRLQRMDEQIKAVSDNT